MRTTTAARYGWIATIVALALGSSGLATGCAVNPATGQRQLSFISESEEIQMGREADQQIVAAIGLYPDEDLQAYVHDLGTRLAAVSERPDLPWTFRVLDDPSVNAFALPGGFIYVTRGIMAHLTSEAQLVGILGHEIGHVTARHSVNQISRQQLTQIGFGLGMVFVPELRPFGDVASLGLQLVSLKFSRDDESQADLLGFRYMTRVDYDPRELEDVFAMLNRVGGGDEGRLPGWLSTHPDPVDREAEIRRMVAEANQDFSTFVVSENSYLRRLDGIIFGQNPREGYFEEAVFHHPDLAFRIDFPSGWNFVNQKSSVQGISAREDAAMILEFAEESTAGAALAAFFAQEGVRRGRTWSDPVGGFPAAGGDFQVRTQQGTLEGTVAFIEYGGNVYQILGYAPSSRWSAYSGVVSSSIASFRRETDPEVLGKQPDRLALVDLSGPIALSTFVERYPSSVPAEEVALLNHVLVGGELPAGRLAKRIVGGSSR